MSLELHIIHLQQRIDRMESLSSELASQGISHYRIWPGIKAQPAYKGIAEAHKNVVRYAQHNGLSEVLIAEDDLKFTDIGAFDYFISEKPANFDLYLASVSSGVISMENTVQDFSGLTMYIVKQPFYSTFLATPNRTNLDRALAHRGKYFVCSMFAVIQSDGVSDNTNEHSDYSNYFVGRSHFRNKKES